MPAPGHRLVYCGDESGWPRRFRDAGHEVVVLPADASADQLAAVAVQEDVALVAVADAELGAAAVAHLDRDVLVFWVTSGSGSS